MLTAAFCPPSRPMPRPPVCQGVPLALRPFRGQEWVTFGGAYRARDGRPPMFGEARTLDCTPVMVIAFAPEGEPDAGRVEVLVAGDEATWVALTPSFDAALALAARVGPTLTEDWLRRLGFTEVR